MKIHTRIYNAIQMEYSKNDHSVVFNNKEISVTRETINLFINWFLK